MQTTEFYLYHNGYCDLYKFYQVVKRTAKTVTLRQVRSANGKPIANDFADNEGEIRKTIKSDGSVNFTTWSYARPWSGEALNHNHPMWGTNYNVY
jgi:hypothetical protein